MPESIDNYAPQILESHESSERGRKAIIVWLALAVASLSLLGTVLLAPVLTAEGWTHAASSIYMGFRVACHQLPDRAFYIDGFPLAVCARCTGLYAGAAAGVLFYPLARQIARTDLPARKWLFLAAIPTTVDFALGVTGIWENTHLSRFFSATLLGITAAFFVVPGIVAVGLTPWKRLLQSGTYAKG